jgi:hypothetical protein
MASGARVRLQAERSGVRLNSQPGLRSGRQVKDALYRETLQTTGRTTRILNRPKRVWSITNPSTPSPELEPAGSVHTTRRVEGPSSLRFSGMTESIGPM